LFFPVLLKIYFSRDKMNHLQHETSPYLLQHARNPVDWYAWKPEAFERAKREQKPIMVSIGYSTCHWCHVMERESFENEDIATFMNENFINIKVDREERPDVDGIYMEACQILTGGGGWPLNCFLTPEGKPFYAGTYFPPRPAHNRPSWLQLLQHLAGIWESKRDVALEQAEKLLNHIRRNDALFISKTNPEALNSLSPEIPKPLNPESIFYQMRERFDRVEGGFGGAPKFPSTMAIQFLLNYHYFTGNTESLEHALFSLEKMIHGGIYDQVGGGFARYATDREWLVPHFEKMLYDNALLVSVLSEAYKLPSTVHRPPSTVIQETIEETLEFVLREMTHPEGGFYSALDADSEGVEGQFYVWDKSEIEKVLGAESGLFCAFYGVTEEGNWEGKNILWRPAGFEAFAEANNLPVAELKQRLKVCREKLYAVRSGRVWPGLDDKVLLDWNALMTSAFVAAYTALGHEQYRAAAIRNIDFLLARFSSQSPMRNDAMTNDEMTNDEMTSLRHSWKSGPARYDAFLDDYAFLIAALTDVYQITFEERYLQLAGLYTEHVMRHFYDTESGMFFFTGAQQVDVILRKRDLYDNATPSGNSTMAHNLQRLGILLDRREWRETATGMLHAMRDTLERYPLSFERWATAALNEVWPLHEIAVVGGNATEKAMAIQRLFLPNKVVAAAPDTGSKIPLLAGRTGAADALIYVCRDFVCRRPVVGMDAFLEAIVE
jgi:uncharacterized protein YyaL (SSP411 family)